MYEAMMFSTTTIKDKNEEILQLFKQGALEKALQLALKLSNNTNNRNPEDLIDTNNNLGLIYKAMHSYNQAEKYFLKVLGLSPNDDIATYNLADVYFELGIYNKAEELYLNTIKTMRKKYGNYHIDLSSALNNLANFYYAIGSYSQAEQSLLQVIDIRRNVLSDKDALFAQTLCNLATLYDVMGRTSDAIELHEQALNIRREILSADDPAIARSLNNIAVMYRIVGRYPDAINFYQQAISIFSKSNKYKRAHAEALHNLGRVFQEVGNFEKAHELFIKSKNIVINLLGEEHIETANIYDSLANLLVALDNKDDAYKLKLKAITIHNRILSKVLSFVSEKQRMAYLASQKRRNDVFISLVMRYFKNSDIHIR
ncbi:MAG: tetratricopeptide repeat protein, partial [Crenarchaeota archaeon]|nr:tetratricopeptide repeat protein [Thermoproteota archaeon]